MKNGSIKYDGKIDEAAEFYEKMVDAEIAAKSKSKNRRVNTSGLEFHDYKTIYLYFSIKHVLQLNRINSKYTDYC